MKLHYLLLCILSFFIACKSNSLRKQTITTDYSTEIFLIDQDSSRQGRYVELNLSGDTLTTAHYVDNKLQGERRIYGEAGALLTMEHYQADAFHGPIVTFYENGQIETKGNYSNNMLDSLFYSYYETGELKEKVIIKDNEENGPFEEYYKSGAVHWKGTFINGPNEVGELLEFGPTGELIKKMICGPYRGEYICQTVWNLEDGDQEILLQFDN